MPDHPDHPDVPLDEGQPGSDRLVREEVDGHGEEERGCGGTTDPTRSLALIVACWKDAASSSRRSARTARPRYA
jgi:hypothetical protein